MSDTPEDFDKLRRLLKLKRHESPPPGYYSNFSARVIGRIEAQSGREAAWGEASWLTRIFALLESNPLAAGVFGISICALLLSGIAYSQHQAPDYAPGSNLAVEVADTASVVPKPQWTRSSWADSATPSMNPMLSTNVPGALFGGVQQVNFTVTQ